MSCGCTNNNGSNNNNDKPSAVQTITNGVKGIAKAVVGMDKADDNVIKLRRNECRNCEYATKNNDKVNTPTKGLTNFSRCLKCSCVIMFKSSLATEKCPIGKW